MKLIDMAHKAGEGEMLPCPTPCEYPYGLRLTLNQAQLEALGMQMPVAGTALHLEAHAIVTRSSTEDPDADGDVDYVCVEVQLTELGIESGGEKEPEGKVADRERKVRGMYGNKDTPKVGEKNLGGSPEKGEFGALTRRVGD